ncbi:NAD(P)H-hydrate dehydratase [Paracoccus sp. S-4012]|uniref:NAD(P)H-hydrate dehydratase n=1 Tax=Paracoccus sp. S-4012 TaxID=2665648 RepID=UPI0012B0A4B1|nr:NAD(P)H-hydrate dehydratase [Paracoccus sp. S-4012]MRX51113.1 NAD(P)H-hydrate dehydratase [Paracoccus sp. S-4012]
MSEPAILDSAWLRAHPLPVPPEDTDKNSRGRVLVVGGSLRVPGGLTLTAEAALRAGAGKVQLALPEPLAVPTGMVLPECGIRALPVDGEGEIASVAPLAGLVDACDCLVLGPAMVSAEAAGAALDALLGEAERPAAAVLDAAAIAAAAGRATLLDGMAGRLILTPHVGEAALLLGIEAETIEADREGIARGAAERFGAIITLKGATTLIAAPEGALLRYGGGGVGLATGGSGDVLAGIVGALFARGMTPFEAAAWGVWLHGEAGRRLAERHGPMGFLARELAPELPSLMRGI